MMVIRKYRFPLVNIKYDVRVINRKHKQTDDDQSRRSVAMQMLYFSINVYLMKYFTTAPRRMFVSKIFGLFIEMT